MIREPHEYDVEDVVGAMLVLGFVPSKSQFELFTNRMLTAHTRYEDEFGVQSLPPDTMRKVLAKAVEERIQGPYPLRVPITSGLDSRLIFAVLRNELGYRENLLSFTQGSSDNADRRYALELVKSLGVLSQHEDIQIQPNSRDLQYDFDGLVSRIRRREAWRVAGVGQVGSRPPAESSRIGFNHISFNGYLGDVLAGRALPPHPDCSSDVQALQHFEKRNRPWKWQVASGTGKAWNIRRVLPESLPLKPEIACFHDQLDWALKQHHRVGVAFNEAKAPYTDWRWMGHWLHVDANRRVNRQYLKEFVAKVYPEIFPDLLPNSAAAARLKKLQRRQGDKMHLDFAQILGKNESFQACWRKTTDRLLARREIPAAVSHAISEHRQSGEAHIRGRGSSRAAPWIGRQAYGLISLEVNITARDLPQFAAL